MQNTVSTQLPSRRLPVECDFSPDGLFEAWFRVGSTPNLREGEQLQNTKAQPEQRIIFLHIPKTAGFTLQKIIERQYPPQSIYTLEPSNELESIREFQSLDPAQRAKTRLLKGHLNMGQKLHEYLPQPVTYFTILRDPVERVLSHYYNRTCDSRLERGTPLTRLLIPTWMRRG